MITDQAFILHKRPYKDSSELIKLITMNHGFVDVIAKGSQRPKSKLNGQLQPFTRTQVNLIGRSALKTLIDAEQTAVFKRCSYINHVSMLYCNELLVLLSPDGESMKALFTSYCETIDLLSTDQHVHLALRQFEWQLCCAVGYELTLPVTIKDSEFIKFDHENGLVKDIKKEFCQAKSFSDFLSKKVLNNAELRQLGRLMKVVVKHMVGGREIQSRHLFIKNI